MLVEAREPWAQHCSFGPGGHRKKQTQAGWVHAPGDRARQEPRGLSLQPVRFNRHWVSLGMKNDDDGGDGDNMMIANISVLKVTRFSRYAEHRSRSIGCVDIPHFTEGYSMPGPVLSTLCGLPHLIPTTPL